MPKSSETFRRFCAASYVLFCAAIFLLPATRGIASAENPLYVTGTAYEQDTGQLVYREYHYCAEDGLVCSIEYRSPDDELLATKALDYRTSAHAPSVAVDDKQHGRQFQVAAQPDSDIVVDAGFDNFVRSRWDELHAGERVDFRFQVLGSDRSFNMQAKRRQAENCAVESICLKVEVSSWFLGLLAQPLELVYDRQERRLLQFSGVSNLRSAKDNALQVDINYQYAAAKTETPQRQISP